MAETPRSHDQTRSATPKHRPVVAGSGPQRDGDYGLGIPPSTAGEGRVQPQTEVEGREQARTLAPDLGSDVADKDPQRDGDHGLGRPPPTTERGRELTPGENRQRDRQEKEQDQEQIRREFERVLQQQDVGRFRLPKPILNFLSWTFLAAASVLGLLLIGQGAAAVGHIRVLPTPLAWVAGVAAGGFSLILIVLVVRLGWALMRLRRSPAVNLAGLQALNERRRWQKLAILHADQARLQLREYLEEFESEKAHRHLNDDERTRLKNARHYLLEGPQALSASEWLEAFNERFQAILDGVAARRVRSHAVRVGIGTAASRFPLLDQAIVLSTCMAMLRELLALYGLRPTTFQAALLLAHSVMATYLSGALQDVTDGLSESGPLPDIMEDITEGVEGVEEVGAGIVGNLAAGTAPVIGKLFERASEGAINGVLVWRLGSSAIKQIQPLRSAR